MTALRFRPAEALLLAALSACAVLPARGSDAVETESTPPAARLRLHVDGGGGGALGATAVGRRFAVLLRGPAIRIQPDAGEDRTPPSTYLLKLGPAPGAWLRDEASDIAVPVPDASGPYWYDPANPCATTGGRCDPAPPDVIAGRLVRGWNYRGSPRGPDGSRDGVLWLDADTGLLLGYRARLQDGRGTRRMQVDEVAYGPLPASLFEVPSQATGDGVDPRGGTKPSRLRSVRTRSNGSP